MYLAAVLLLGFGCVTLLYCSNAIQRWTKHRDIHQKCLKLIARTTTWLYV